WSEAPEMQARASLRQALFTLRRALATTEPALLVFDGQSVALAPAAIDVDVGTFEARAGEGTPEGYEAAARLYPGDLLAGLPVDAAPFEDGLLAERERLRERALEALAKLLAYQRGIGALEAAVQTALRLVALEPLQEAVHRTLMRLYVELGRRGPALRQYQACVAALQRGLRVEPEGQTRALYGESLRQRPRGPGADGAVETAAADASAGTATPAWIDVLPREGMLVGRGGEMDRLRGILEQTDLGRGRIVTVLGEAGVGKSRLVAEVAAEASQRGWRVLVGRAYE